MSQALLAAYAITVTAVTSPPLRAAPIFAGQGATDTLNYRYIVEPQDTLYTLADAYLLHPSDARAVQRLNRVRDPRRLRPGAALLLPRALLRTVPLRARVVAFRGSVTVDGRSVTRTTTLGEGALVETAGNGFVSLALADGTTVTLPSASRIRIARLRRLLISGELERVFNLEAGRSQLQVTPRHLPGDRFEVVTPLSVAAVRGTEFRVASLDDGRATATEVLEGVVGVGATAGGDARLIAGTGTRTTAAGTKPPVALLPAPTLAEPGQTQSAPTIAFALRPVAGAVRYRLQIAADAGFLDILAERENIEPAVGFPALANGDYFVRATALDVNGLEGRPRVYSFERALNGVRASASASGGRRFLFRWMDLGDGAHTYRFVLAREATPNEPLVDEAGLTGHGFAVTNLPPGDYVWRVQTSAIVNGRLRADWAAPQTLTVGARRR